MNVNRVSEMSILQPVQGESFLARKRRKRRGKSTERREKKDEKEREINPRRSRVRKGSEE